jgi:Fur family transcriptional regulator, ferric uptake regulator
VNAQRAGGPVSTSRGRVERGTDTVRQVMEQRGLRLTRAREAVVRMALQLPGHFCARTLAERVVASGHDGSLNTVYRLLPLMIEAGVLRETAMISEHGQLFEDVFERDNHEHLRCVRCQEIVEFELPALIEAERRLASQHDFLITGRAYELQGVCPMCRERETEQPS